MVGVMLWFGYDWIYQGGGYYVFNLNFKRSLSLRYFSCDGDELVCSLWILPFLLLVEFGLWRS